MKKNVRYECEVCGSEYLLEELALRCEASKPPRPLYRVGSRLPISSRYDGIVWVKCTGMHLEDTCFASYARDYNQNEWIKIQEISKSQGREMHHWIIELAEYVQIGKDDSQNKVGLHSVMDDLL
ncbi:hypothetical protein LCGC14_0977370 [marine sediment metagenome]|uniref:Uncharacterized protein n=1 Tax=marine sediment metagenome TaxID=412755 RepID=A0A0F9NW43_9ZZZZ